MSRKKFTITENNLGERLKTIRKTQSLTQQAFARRLNTSPSYISDVEAGKTAPGSKFLTTLLRNFNINLHWLLTGEGEMEKGVEKDDKGEYSVVTQKIFQMLEGMTEDDQRDILRYIEKEKLFKELMEEKKQRGGR
jgi:transcriptional regulator with XRE-family HTH domain